MDFIFTNWNYTGSDANAYFYFRGALWGFVCATLLWNIVIPFTRKKIRYYLYKRELRLRRY